MFVFISVAENSEYLIFIIIIFVVSEQNRENI